MTEPLDLYLCYLRAYFARSGTTQTPNVDPAGGCPELVAAAELGDADAREGKVACAVSELMQRLRGAPSDASPGSDV